MGTLRMFPSFVVCAVRVSCVADCRQHHGGEDRGVSRSIGRLLTTACTHSTISDPHRSTMMTRIVACLLIASTTAFVGPAMTCGSQRSGPSALEASRRDILVSSAAMLFVPTLVNAVDDLDMPSEEEQKAAEVSEGRRRQAPLATRLFDCSPSHP